jgi:hypothetical protein
MLRTDVVTALIKAQTVIADHIRPLNSFTASNIATIFSTGVLA